MAYLIFDFGTGGAALTHYAMDAAPGSYATTGVAAGIPVGRMVNTDIGTYATTGISVDLLKMAWQYVRPTSDIATNSWTPSTGANLYATVDEVVPDNSDYNYSPNNPTTQMMELGFATATDPVSSANYYFDYRLEARNFDTTFDFDLVQNTTVLDSWSEAVTAGAGVVERTKAFSGAVIDSITNHADVRVRIVARAP